MSHSFAKKIVGFDVDGALADFNALFIKTAKKLLGKRIPETASGWNLGTSPQEAGEILDDIFHNQVNPWRQLPPVWKRKSYKRIAERMLNREWLTYFITHRFCENEESLSAQTQTAQWLEKRGIINPCVIISGKKGIVCKALGIQYYIDDRPKYCLDVRRDSPDTKVFCVRIGWNNRPIKKGGLQGKGVKVIDSLDEFIDRILK